jgi:hypothetical protein
MLFETAPLEGAIFEARLTDAEPCSHPESDISKRAASKDAGAITE